MKSNLAVVGNMDDLMTDPRDRQAWIRAIENTNIADDVLVSLAMRYPFRDVVMRLMNDRELSRDHMLRLAEASAFPLEIVWAVILHMLPRDEKNSSWIASMRPYVADGDCHCLWMEVLKENLFTKEEMEVMVRQRSDLWAWLPFVERMIELKCATGAELHAYALRASDMGVWRVVLDSKKLNRENAIFAARYVNQQNISLMRRIG